MISISDYGIILEMFGFIIILLVGGRNPKRSYLALEEHEDDRFDQIREKIIPDKLIHMFLIIGIGAIIIGLSFQLSYFSPV